MDRDYRYFVVVSENYQRDNPAELVRTWEALGGVIHEEIFTPQLAWKRDDLLERIRRGSVYGNAEVAIPEQEYQQVLPVITERFKRQMEETRRILGE